jgi:hypothetical protein
MNLPLNGRIAIIDDQYQHAEPLMHVLSQKQLPFTYFSGEQKFLPEENNNQNDIRVLFLDINLIDDSEHEDKVLKSTLLPVLNRVISATNHPYLIVFWSRHEAKHRNLLENDIFRNELKDKKPIGYLSADKYSLFQMTGEKQEDFDEKISLLFEKINAELSRFPAYNYLLQWENQVHQSADKTLQEIFSTSHTFANWSGNANYILNKLGKSFSGKVYDTLSPENKMKSCSSTLNIVFSDTIEHLSNTSIIPNAPLLVVTNGTNTETLYTINKKLLTSSETEPLSFSGTIIEDGLKKHKSVYPKDLFNNIINISKLEQIMIKEHSSPSGSKLRKLISAKRQEIRSDWKTILLVATPLCDFVQRKFKYNRIIKGVMIKSEFLEFIDDKSEAIFISPPFNYGDHNYIIVLHFKYFFTIENLNASPKLKPIFRVRQQLLAEVQSKLARHMSRQGILFID